MYQKASTKYEILFSDRTKGSISSIKRGLRVYREKDKKGRELKIRDDRKTCRVIIEEEQSELIRYLDEHPGLPATQAVKALQREDKIYSKISQSSL